MAEKFEFTESERIGHALTTGAQGNEVLVGLTLEETAFLMCQCVRNFRNRRILTPEQHKRCRDLREKHEIARQLRNDKPTLS